MSVDSRIYVGLTLELGSNLTAADFKRLHALDAKYPEIEEDRYHTEDREGKLLLVYDGMCGDFARLIFVDKLIEGGSLGDANEFIELPAPGKFNPELIEKMFDIYEEYTDTRPATTDFKYAMWSQWY